MTIKLIIGISNPGSEYSSTRHNVGSWYVEQLAIFFQKQLKKENKFFGYTAQYNLSKYNVRLLVSDTFMNISGKAVSAISRFYHITPEEILIAHDDLNLPPGIIRLKFGGYSGHNGIKSIISYLGNNSNFYRLRIGIGRPNNREKITSFVLKSPTINEKQLINDAIIEAISCTNVLIEQSPEKAMNRLHHYKPKPIILNIKNI